MKLSILYWFVFFFCSFLIVVVLSSSQIVNSLIFVHARHTLKKIRAKDAHILPDSDDDDVLYRSSSMTELPSLKSKRRKYGRVGWQVHDSGYSSDSNDNPLLMHVRNRSGKKCGRFRTMAKKVTHFVVKWTHWRNCVVLRLKGLCAQQVCFWSWWIDAEIVL